jgi:hypothetical protein
MTTTAVAPGSVTIASATLMTAVAGYAEFHLMTGAAHMSPLLDIDALANQFTRHATTR